MVAKKKSRSRREIAPAFNGRDLKVNGKGVPLRTQAAEALRNRLVTIESPAEQLSTLLEHFDTGVHRAA